MLKKTIQVDIENNTKSSRIWNFTKSMHLVWLTAGAGVKGLIQYLFYVNDRDKKQYFSTI